MGTEIISADSRQVYKEMTIGTAVPSMDQLKSVKHHFVQSKSINSYFNASIYEKEVLELLTKLYQKYDKVILSGGTGLYIDTVRHGIDDLPEVDMDLRNELRKRIEKEGLESLRRELKILDPLSYERIDLKNPKRVQKALEVSLTTGKPYSGFLNRKKKRRDFSVKLIALNIERSALYKRINERTDLMIRDGWLEEVKRLQVYKGSNALNTVGYKELFAYLDGLCSFEEALEKIKANTRKYARKQLTWLRKDPDYRWFTPDQTQEILNYIGNE